ncbi:MAG: alpha/beta fold hydrolase [Planctomycetota bacterium]
MRKSVFYFLLFSSFAISELLAYEILKETAMTSDGVLLAIKRYRNDGATPIILQHGLAQNLYVWDLPVSGQSLAVYLAERGFDVWIPSLRGGGQGEYTSEDVGGAWDWSIDDFAIFDVPAIISKVSDSTGKKPFWVGHSMGGMIAYAYLQGVKYESVKIDTKLEVGWGLFFPTFTYEDVYDIRVVADASLAEERQAELAGLITVASPATIAWKYNPSIFTFLLYPYFDHNLLLSTLAKSYLLPSVALAIGKVPSGQILNFLTDDLADLPLVGSSLTDFFEFVSNEWGSSFAASDVWNADHMSPEIIQATLDYTLDDISAHVLKQFADGIKNRTFREYHVKDPARFPYVYKDHYDVLKLPLLVLAGNHDKMACDNKIYELGYLKFSSVDKTYHVFPKYGHADICNGIPAPTEVYPVIESWIRERE